MRLNAQVPLVRWLSRRAIKPLAQRRASAYCARPSRRNSARKLGNPVVKRIFERNRIDTPRPTGRSAPSRAFGAVMAFAMY
jgi:hypothetical protein